MTIHTQISATYTRRQARQIAAPTHPAPVVYHQWKIQLLDEHGDGEACYAIVLGQVVYGDTWPELRANIDRAAFPGDLPRGGLFDGRSA